MFRNIITIALRVLWRQKLYAGINLLGLSVAIALSLLVALFVVEEYSYDRFHTNADRLYLLNQHENPPDRDEFGSTSTPFVLGPSLAEQSAAVEHVVRLTDWNTQARVGTEAFDVKLTYVDDSFFDVFSFELLESASANPLQNLSGVVLSESVAERLLGTGPWVGDTVLLELDGEEAEFTVTGVTVDPPATSSIDYQILVPFDVIHRIAQADWMTMWMIVWPKTYVLLQEGASTAQLDQALQAMYEANDFAGMFGEGGLWYEYLPITDIHLHSQFASPELGTSSPVYSRILLGIALLILIVASVNYTSLALGRSVTRSKEVGLRKVMGAAGSQLRRQFLSESLLLAALAVPVAWVLAELALPWFNNVAGRELMLSLDPLIGGILLALVLLIGISSGLYPAVVLARYNPHRVLKGQASVGGGSRFIRGLVVLQYSLAALLLIGTILMGQQLQFLLNRDLGYQGEQVVNLSSSTRSRDVAADLLERFRARALQEPGVLQVSAVSNTFGGVWGQVGFDTDDGQFMQVYANSIDPDLFETMDLQLVAGREYSQDRPGDFVSGIIVNEAMVRFMGWDDPLGQRLPCSEMDAHEVIGVVQDFNFQSLHNEVEPLVLFVEHTALAPGINDVVNYSGVRNELLVRLDGSDIAGTMRTLEGIWHQVAPEMPFAPEFLESRLNAYYQNERTLSGVVRVASGLTVLIAAMGLFGLVSLAVARRTKEIGVRKVLGATVPQILTLMAREFSILILVATLLAWPLGWFAAQRWLEGFAYRIDLNPLVFVVVTLSLLVMSWLTIVLLSLRTATRNPAHALRYE
ncbi:ABC transporter permease [bacterium]|nr:ABC transporter permease [bacterium]